MILGHFALEKFQNPWPKLGLVDQHENNRQGHRLLLLC